MSPNRKVLFTTGILLCAAAMHPIAATGSNEVSVPPQDNRILRHQVLIDVPRDRAIFDLWFWKYPRFFQRDDQGGQRHAFQYYLRVLEFADFVRRRHTGEPVPPLRPMLVVSGGEIHVDRKVIVREVDPLLGNDPQSGPWGPKVAEVPYRQEGRRVRFSVPRGIFDHADGMQEEFGFGSSLHYYLEFFGDGRSLSLQEGLATVAGADSEAQLIVAPRFPDRPIWPTRKGPLVVDVITRPAEFYGSYLFAELVDVESIRFGPNEAQPYRARLIHANDDNYLDLRLWFDTSQLGLTCLDNELWLVGEQWDGQQTRTFVGYDEVRIASCAEPS